MLLLLIIYLYICELKLFVHIKLQINYKNHISYIGISYLYLIPYHYSFKHIINCKVN